MASNSEYEQQRTWRNQVIIGFIKEPSKEATTHDYMEVIYEPSFGNGLSSFMNRLKEEKESSEIRTLAKNVKNEKA